MIQRFINWCNDPIHLLILIFSIGVICIALFILSLLSDIIATLLDVIAIPILITMCIMSPPGCSPSCLDTKHPSKYVFGFAGLIFLCVSLIFLMGGIIKRVF